MENAQLAEAQGQIDAEDDDDTKMVALEAAIHGWLIEPDEDSIALLDKLARRSFIDWLNDGLRAYQFNVHHTHMIMRTEEWRKHYSVEVADKYAFYLVRNGLVTL